MLSDFRRRKFTAFFDHLDLNNDGVISHADFVRYAEVVKAERGWSDDEARLAGLVAATDAWWQDLLDHVAEDGADAVTKEGWLEFHESLGQRIQNSGAPPQWAFDMCIRTHQLLDLNGDGTVCAAEYGLWLRSIGSKADPERVFERLDLNKDGVVDLSEMMMLFGQFIMSEDENDPGNYIMTGEI